MAGLNGLSNAPSCSNIQGNMASPVNIERTRNGIEFGPAVAHALAQPNEWASSSSPSA